MTHQQREFFSHLLASLFYPPDQELIDQIHQRMIYSFFKEYTDSLNEQQDLLKGFLEQPGSGLDELREEYDRLFSDFTQDSISLVESYYKAWTVDPSCALPFASERGLLMGDSALHLLEVYDQCGLKTSEEFRSCPDHISLELEFLSYLYQCATGAEIKMFINDHLNWIPLLKEEVNRHQGHPFYVSALEILTLFVDRERERLGA